MSATENWLDAVIRLRRPMEPIATEVPARVEKLSGIRAVVFDVYGTLVISGSGDVGSADSTDQGARIREAFDAVGWQAESCKLPTIDQLHQQIKLSNDGAINANCPKPEVDIVQVWSRTLQAAGLKEWADDVQRVVRLSAEYEARANPTWPMPGAKQLLGQLADSSVPMGIVSNAQAFTLPLVEELSSGSQADRGFDLDLCIYSYRYRQAKPGPRLFQALNEGLKRRRISPHEAVYVGNDMLNDVWAAGQSGLRTAWFVGDGRSCRKRDQDSRCQAIRPDVVLTNLLQLLECLDIK